MDRGRKNVKKKGQSKFGEVAESSHGRSFASRLGMAEMSCFPSSRSRRSSDIYDVSRTSSQASRRSNFDQNRSMSSSGGGPNMFRSLERGKAQAFPQSLRDNGEVTGGLTGHGDNKCDSEASSSDEDVFEIGTTGESVRGEDTVQTYKSPLYVETSTSTSSSGRRKKTETPTIFNSHGVYGAGSSSNPASATTRRPSDLQTLRSSSSSSRRGAGSGNELVEFGEQTRPINSRRLSSSEIRRVPPSLPNNSASRGATSRLTSPLRSIRNSRLRHGNVDNMESGPYNRRASTRRNTPSNPSNSRAAEQEDSGQEFRRRNMSNCFPAFGNNAGRRSSSQQAAFATTSTSSSSSSSQGAVSIFATAVGSRNSTPASDGVPSHGMSWSSSGTTFGWEYHRPRLMAEGLAKVLMAIERMEGDEELTHEQLLMLEATVLFGGMALHDEHRDLRLDVDSMSYEELLALGDRIGTVSTGVSQDMVISRLHKTKFNSLNISSSPILRDGERKCSICQEEYENGDELGGIQCGHKYHASCIGQWLVQKNLCPVCKATALTV